MRLFRNIPRYESQYIEEDVFFIFGKSMRNSGIVTRLPDGTCHDNGLPVQDGWYFCINLPFTKNRKYICSTTFDNKEGPCRYRMYGRIRKHAVREDLNSASGASLLAYRTVPSKLYHLHISKTWYSTQPVIKEDDPYITSIQTVVEDEVCTRYAEILTQMVALSQNEPTQGNLDKLHALETESLELLKKLDIK